jgi:hypothetical protein
MGGIGKTVLAVALAHDSEVWQAFPDGIHWPTVGQKPNLLYFFWRERTQVSLGRGHGRTSDPVKGPALCRSDPE